MKKSKHVLVLIILILPMFVFAPALVASPNTLNEVSTNQVPVEFNLPAEFAEETLRVAVYAETNTTLPLYASGGVSTAYHTNLIQFLESHGCAVTALSTQDILDHKLMIASYDVFVLVNNLPKDEIVDYVMDYWLGGGGILSFDSGLGFMYYHGMVVPGDTGAYALLDIDPSPHWGFDVVVNITVGARHSTAKDYAIDDVIPLNENTSIHDSNYFEGANPTDFVPLLIESPSTSVGFALDNTERQGGRIVQLPGNCSVIPSWESSIILDSIDWLTPRPKGRILYDLNHDSWISIDPWDPYQEYYPMQTWRNGMVNHSYIVDKLYSDLTPSILAHYDMLVITMPNGAFTAAEVEAVRSWVENGGGLFLIGDEPLGSIVTNSNFLISPYGISLNTTAGTTGFDVTCVPAPELHPLNENALYLYFGDGSFLNITGDAYPLWYSDDNIVGAGQEYGQGRVIVSGDGNMAADGLYILEQDNYQYLLNVANWLTAAKAKMLVYVDHGLDPRDPNQVPINGPVAQALNDLGIPFYITSSGSYFNLSLYYQHWDMVVFDNINYVTGLYQTDIMEFVQGGGKLIFSTWSMTPAFRSYFGIETVDYINAMPPDVFFWEAAHPMFNMPAPYGLNLVNSTLNIFGGGGTYAINFTIYDNATAYAGYSPASDGGAGIIISANGRAIINGPLITCYGEDTDDSTYPDNFELWLNQIGYLYFDRPTVNHPADVTYMETETGNEISWLPTADAGPWHYVIRENGSIIDSGRWYGGAISINVDGITASLTDYQLTVFDRLGYSASDEVVLNVTEYVVPTTTNGGGGGAPLDPTILLIVGAAGVVIVIIIIIMMKKKK